MPRSTYSKIHQILLVSSEEGPREISELATLVRDRKLEAFEIFRRNDSGTVTKSIASPQSIRRNIRLAVDFGVLEMDEGTKQIKISKLGDSCLKGDKYGSVLGQAIIDFLEENKGRVGFDFDDLRTAISNCEIPTRQNIQQSIAGLQVTEEWFRKILYLLACCERIHYQDSRIYSA